MEKKSTKKAAPKKKAAVASKKKIVKKEVAEVPESHFFAPEATPHVETYANLETKAKVSFWSKVKDFLGF